MTYRTAWLFLSPLLAGVIGLGWYFGREQTKVVAPPVAATVPVATAFAELRDFPIFMTDSAPCKLTTRSP
jgi:hypothetical protein